MLPVILGLDAQKTRIGWAFVSLDDCAPIACGCERLAAGPRRSLSIREVMRTIHHHGGYVSIVYIEAPFAGPNRYGALEHAMVIGEVRQACSRRFNVPVELIAAPRWKALAGLRGNATKAAVAMAAVNVGFRSDSQDALDAGLIARAGWCLNSSMFSQAPTR